MSIKVQRRSKVFIIIFIAIIVIITIAILIFSNKNKSSTFVDSKPFLDDNGRLIIITSLFPVYDFAKIVGGDKANVSLILPPGAEAHSFKPQPKDIELIKKAAIFFYTSDLMEPWAAPLKNDVTPKTRVIASADGLNGNSPDPHVWLDFDKAGQMVDKITVVYQNIDPANSLYYQANADIYKKKLMELDADYSHGLADCKFHEFISGGHFTYGYLADRYHLKYQSALGLIPDLNFDTQKIIALGEELKKTGQPYVYYEEMIMPHFAEILRQESGANLMSLNAAHNVGRFDIESGISFISLMRNNLDTLKRGLICN